MKQSRFTEEQIIGILKEDEFADRAAFGVQQRHEQQVGPLAKIGYCASAGQLPAFRIKAEGAEGDWMGRHCIGISLGTQDYNKAFPANLTPLVP